MRESYICINVCPHCGNEQFSRTEHVDMNFLVNSFTNLICEYPLDEEKTFYTRSLDYDDWDYDDE